MSQDLPYLLIPTSDELAELLAEQEKLKEQWSSRVHTPAPHEERYARALHSDDAFSLFVQGRYAEALEKADDGLKAHIEKVAEVIHREDTTVSCLCGPTNLHTFDTVFSLVHKSFKTILRCNKCGQLTLK